MSLPSTAIFKYKGEKVSESFVNCGWFYDGENLQFIKRLLLKLDYPNCDWDELVMYNEKYTYREVINLVMNEV